MYQKTEGPYVIPFDWFIALDTAITPTATQPCPKGDHGTFASDANLVGMGLVINPTNKNGLPVGFVRSDTPRLFDLHWIGFTCAACHTGELRYQGKSYRIHGGAPMLDSLIFNGQIRAALTALLKDAKRLQCFADRIGGKAELVQRQVDGFIKAAEEVDPPSKAPKVYPTPWGYGRIDAFGRGGNTLLAALIDKESDKDFGQDNRIPANAPVSPPPLWWAWNYLWVQWNGSIKQPLSRNITAVTTATRRLKFDDPRDSYKTDVDVEVLHHSEEVTAKIAPPRWPAAFDADKDPGNKKADAKAGKAIYAELCVRCHAAAETKDDNGHTFYDLKQVSLQEIGTDENHAVNFNKRKIKTGRLEPKLGKKEMDAVEFMELYSQKIIEARLGMDPASRREKEGFRDNKWLAPLAYIARPHAGIWATPPFLHNGSVPNIYELLSPVAERSKCFYVGPQIEYDPKHAGLTSQACDGKPDPKNRVPFYDRKGFKFDTEIDGNHNMGHEFKGDGTGKGVIGRGLSPQERLQLIEYLKSCDLQEVQGDKDWKKIRDRDPQMCM